MIGMEIDITIIEGKDLVAKDKKMFGKGSSDPYIVLHGVMAGRTRTPKKSVCDTTYKHNTHRTSTSAARHFSVHSRCFS